MKAICEKGQTSNNFFTIFYRSTFFYVDNGDDIQSTEETMLLPENYEEEDKIQDATKKPGDKMI